MIRRFTPVEGVHSCMLNTDDMMEVTKADCRCTGYRCECSDDNTHILMRSGNIYIVEESINTIEASIAVDRRERGLAD